MEKNGPFSFLFPLVAFSLLPLFWAKHHVRSAPPPLPLRPRNGQRERHPVEKGEAAQKKKRRGDDVRWTLFILRRSRAWKTIGSNVSHTVALKKGNRCSLGCAVYYTFCFRVYYTRSCKATTLKKQMFIGRANYPVMITPTVRAQLCRIIII